MILECQRRAAGPDEMIRPFCSSPSVKRTILKLNQTTADLVVPIQVLSRENIHVESISASITGADESIDA